MAAVPTNGCNLKLSISSVFTTIPQRVSISIPKISRAAIDTTDLDSTADTVIVGIKRSDPFSFTINWDQANTVHNALFSSLDSGVLESWKYIATDSGASEVAFSGYVVGFESEDIAVDGVQRAKVTVKPSGAVTLTQ